MRRVRSEYAAHLSSAKTVRELGDATVQVTRELVNASGVCFVPFGSDAMSAEGRFFHEQHAEHAIRSWTIAAMPQTERDIGTLQQLFAPGRLVVDLNELCEPKGLVRSETFNDYWRPCNIERQSLALLGSLENPTGFLCVSRSARGRRFDERDMRHMRWLKSHVDTALRILGHGSHQLPLELLVAIDPAISLPCAVFDAYGGLVWVSTRARRIIASHAVRFNGQTILDVSAEAERWQTAARLALSSRAHVVRAGDLEVRPIRHGPRRRFAIVIQHFESQRELAALPPKLARIADALVRGLSDKQIADELDVPLTTVRTYVQRIYRRLGVRGRIDLIRTRLHVLSRRD